MFGKFVITVGRNVDACTPRHVVEDYGRVNAVGDFQIVRDKSGLRAFVIVRRDEQDSLNADRLRVLGKLNGVSRVVGAGARDDRNAPGHVLDGEFNRGFVFVVVHGGGLARGARYANCVRMIFNLVVNHATEFGKVHARLVERCNNRDARAFEWNLFH